VTMTIRPGLSAYLPLGAIAGGLVALWVCIWLYRGPHTGAWQPITLIVGFYIIWCLALWRRVLTIDDNGILCTYLMRKPRRVAWSEVRYSEIVLWIDRNPYQFLVFGDSPNKPLLDIPLKLYDKIDVDFLLSFDRLSIRDAT